MERIPKSPSTNGYNGAPPIPGGASTIPQIPVQARTVFPLDLPPDSVRSFLELFSQLRFAGVRLHWLVAAGLTALALIWVSVGLPGRWIGATFWFAVAVALHLTIVYLRGRDFVHFEAATTPALDQPIRLQPAAKLPVYVTGEMTVDPKTRRFTMLPGFYRTFANGEHVLMCLARPRALFRMPALPVEDRGMWYAFVHPADIQNVRLGLLYHHRQPVPSVALNYQRPSHVSRRRATQGDNQTIYIVCVDPGDTNRLLADLLFQIPTHSIRASIETT